MFWQNLILQHETFWNEVMKEFCFTKFCKTFTKNMKYKFLKIQNKIFAKSCQNVLLRKIHGRTKFKKIALQSGPANKKCLHFVKKKHALLIIINYLIRCSSTSRGTSSSTNVTEPGPTVLYLYCHVMSWHICYASIAKVAQKSKMKLHKLPSAFKMACTLNLKSSYTLICLKKAYVRK